MLLLWNMNLSYSLEHTYYMKNPRDQLFRFQNKYFALRILCRSRHNFVLIYFSLKNTDIVCIICSTKDQSLHLKFVLVSKKLVSWIIPITSALSTSTKNKEYYELAHFKSVYHFKYEWDSLLTSNRIPQGSLFGLQKVHGPSKQMIGWKQHFLQGQSNQSQPMFHL